MKVVRYALCLLFAALAYAQADALDIVRRSVIADDHSAKLAQDYIYTQTDVVHELDAHGNIKSTKVETHEVLFIGGKPYHRLIAKDGKPLSMYEESVEQGKLDRAIAESKALSPEERAKREAEYRQKQAKYRERARVIPDAFNFALLREEPVNGRNCYVISATPKPGYRGPQHEIYSKMQGILWLDKADYHWVKVQAETLDTISFGLFIARLAKGSHLEFVAARVNDEIWLPRSASIKASARFALLKKLNVEQQTTFSNYHRFEADSKIVSSSELKLDHH